MSAFVIYITRTTQVTHIKRIENYKQHTTDLQLVALFFSHLVPVQLSAHKHRLGWMAVCTFRLRSLSCFLIISADIWSLNGRTTRTVSSVSLDDDESCCWSQTFDSTKLLMVELTMSFGYFL